MGVGLVFGEFAVVSKVFVASGSGQIQITTWGFLMSSWLLGIHGRVWEPS